MKARCAAVVVSLLFCIAAKAQRTRETFDPFLTYGVAVGYANSSHDIFAALSQDRKVLNASATVDWRVGRPKHFTYRWEIEVLPVFLVRNPRQVVDFTSTSGTQPPVVTHIDQLISVPCQSDSARVVVTSANGPPTTISYNSVCTQPFVYGGGVSPLGQRLNFRPGHRLQPFAEANAGFVAFTRAVPTSDSTRFNFTAELRGGVEYYRTPRQSFALDLAYHHFSNAGRGDANPSVENYLLKASYRFSR